MVNIKQSKRETHNEVYCVQALTLIEYAIKSNCGGVRNYSNVAQWLGVPNSSITRWQNGIGFPDLYSHFRLAQLIGVNYKDYFRYIREEITLEELLECNYTITSSSIPSSEERLAILCGYVTSLNLKQSLDLSQRLYAHIQEELDHILK